MFYLIKTTRVFVLCSILGIVGGNRVFSVENATDKLLGQKMRGGYMGVKNSDVLEMMGRNGMNLAMVKFVSLHYPMREDEKKLLMKWASDCEKRGLLFMPVINLWGPQEKEGIRHNYNYYYRQTEFNNTPCPLEEGVYDLVVHKRLVELAELSRSVHIAGVAVDLEMYSADVMVYPDYCLCDRCFERFLAGRSVEQPIDAPSRQNYLQRTGQVEKYRAFSSSIVERLARQTAEQVKAVSPDFTIGAFLLDEPVTYCRALARGFGNEQGPALAFTEQTYRSGYSDYIAKAQDRFKGDKANVVLVPGLWQSKFVPENMAEQYYYCARNSGGYWVYSMEQFSSNTNMPLPSSKELYWQAIRKANDELDKLSSDSRYISKLQLRPVQTPPQPINSDGINLQNLRYVQSARAVKFSALKASFRGNTTLVLIAQKGDKISVGLSLQKLGAYGEPSAYAMVTDDSGQVLAKTQCERNGSCLLNLKATYSGAYAVVCNPGVNAFSVSSCSHPLSIYAEQSVNLFKPRGSFYLWKSAGTASGRLAFGVDNLGEAVVATFKNSQGKTLGAFEIASKKTVEVHASPQAMEEAIRVDFTPMDGAHIEDVRIRIISGFGKYIAASEVCLVKQGK